MSQSPVHKRLRLDPSASPSPSSEGDLRVPPIADFSQEDTVRKSVASLDVEDDEDHCIICLQHIRDRTLLPCAHDRMCFECILVWTAQSRKCPLCNATIGPYLIHNIRSKYDYQKRYLPPLRISSPPVVTPLRPLRGGSGVRHRGRAGTDRWGTRSRRRSASLERQEMENELELAVERRKWVYRHGLYAKHVASNPYTRYRPAPTPAQIAASPDIISRTTIFVRRELRVWVNLDVEFLTTFILSLMKTLDLRSESAVKLLAEFLDMDTTYHVGAPSESVGRFTNAEHFAHELYSYLRSPFRDLTAYDAVVQYDIPEHVPSAPSQPPHEPSRWELRSSTQAVASTRRFRRSSLSLLSRSPRDGYSRSPSPVSLEFTEAHVRYSPSRSPKSVNRADSPQLSPANAPTNDRRREVLGRDKKGKGKEIVQLEPDRNTHRRDDDHLRGTVVHASSRKRSRSPRRTSALTGRYRAHTSTERRRRRSSPDTSYSPRHDINDTLDIDGSPYNVASSSALSARITNPTGNPADILRHQAVDSSLDGYPLTVHAAPHAKSEKTWGISIKGQAKLLKQIRSPNVEHNSRGPQEAHPGGPEDTSSFIGTPSLDLPRAHLDRSSVTRANLPDNVSMTNATAEFITHEVHNGEDLGKNPVSQCSDDVLLPDPSAQSSTVGYRSAPEIMARTRAKIARLRGQASVAGIASTSGVDENAREGTPANLGLKVRLLERLREEKKQASMQPSDGQNSAPGSRDRSEDYTNDGSTAPEVETMKSTDREDIATDVSTESRQAETKLRAQALLRVRLAAEKRIFEEEQRTSREDALRAKLLSRRT